ncbi:MAG: SOS response-associated peptidase [Myxococcales bacterium]|nr:SOS response-associated peptidase [Myxococcales bacterium]
MCGRITLTTPDIEAVASMLEAQVSPADARLYKPRYNAAPTDTHWIVQPSEKGRLLVPAVWGFKGGMINARSETADKRFKSASRVIVAADGFYEWTGPRDARQPIWFRPRDGGLLLLAGLAHVLPDGRLAFVVLTTDAAGGIARIHDRMPLIVPREKLDQWLKLGKTGDLVQEIRRVSPDLSATEVSPRVNDVRNDDPSVLQPPSQLGLL